MGQRDTKVRNKSVLRGVHLNPLFSRTTPFGTHTWNTACISITTRTVLLSFPRFVAYFRHSNSIPSGTFAPPPPLCIIPPLDTSVKLGVVFFSYVYEKHNRSVSYSGYFANLPFREYNWKVLSLVNFVCSPYGVSANLNVEIFDKN